MLDPTKIIYVDSPESVAKVTAHVAQSERAAVDTEADSLHHYYEKVCLLQISVPGGDYIVDPLAGLDLSPLMEALTKPTLLLHGADYDLRMLRRDFEFKARDIFDTMTAAQLLGYERFSYAALVERFQGLVLCKQGQKADWSRRPLTDKLVEYAAGDTHYLAEVADRLADELREAGRLSWHEEVCRKLLPEVSEGIREPDTERQWRVKGWATLRTPRAQAVLRELWRWRDQEAQRSDLPPFKIVRNETMIALAAWAHAGLDPKSKPMLPRTFVGRRLRTLLQAVEDGMAVAEADLPKPLTGLRRDQPPPDENLIADLKKVRDRKAEELKLDPGVLLPGACISAIAIALPKDAAELQAAGDLYDWQTDQLGADLLAAVEDRRKAPPSVPVEGSRGGYWKMRRMAKKQSQAADGGPAGEAPDDGLAPVVESSGEAAREERETEEPA